VGVMARRGKEGKESKKESAVRGQGVKGVIICRN
jgi:hypothetical protein